jgi:hypothetical protein
MAQDVGDPFDHRLRSERQQSDIKDAILAEERWQAMSFTTATRTFYSTLYHRRLLCLAAARSMLGCKLLGMALLLSTTFFGSAGMRILTSTRYSLKHDVSPSLLT